MNARRNAAMKIISRIRSFFNKTERQRKRLQRIAKELDPILGFGWTELKEIENEKDDRRVGLMAECFSKVKPGEILIRVILEPARKKTLWFLKSRNNMLVHLLFLPKGKLSPNEEQAVIKALSEECGLAFPEDCLVLNPNLLFLGNFFGTLRQFQLSLETALFFAILPEKVREICDSFEEITGEKLPFYH
jgi:hypothetical protein